MRFTVKQARLIAGKTQTEMAEKLNVSRDTYRKIELFPEKTTIAQALTISDITGIPINQLFFGKRST